MAAVKKLLSPVPQQQSTEDLKKQIDELKGTNKHLQELLQALQTSSIRIKGYLHKYRPFGLGLLSNDWELRYFTLYGTTLKYHKSEKDVTLHPRGQVDVTGCFVEMEGKKGKFWTFGVVDPSGLSLLRLSSDSEATALRWVEELENAGCTRRTVRSLHRTRSPLPGADVRWNPGSPNGSGKNGQKGLMEPAAQKLQDRWEESSTDSEMAPVQPKKQMYLPPYYPPKKAPNVQPGSNLNPRVAAHAGADSDTGSDRPDSPTPNGGSGSPKAPRGPMVGSTPVHGSSKYSILSSERISLHQHSGILNLIVVILITTNFRLILENILKYGLRFNPVRYVRRALAGKGNLPLVLCFPGLLLAALVALGTERLGWHLLKAELKEREGLMKKQDGDLKAAKKLLAKRTSRNERLLFILNAINTTLALILPCVVISYGKTDVVPGLSLVMCTIVVWMKLVSYAHCNWDLRRSRREGKLRTGERGEPLAKEWMVLQYPENLHIKNTLYFLVAPTLTYQINFPRSSRLRKRWLFRRVLELILYMGLFLFITEQYIEPAVANSLQPLRKMDWLRLAERILKLALPNMYAWLCMFYCLFHLWLNILAEMLRFGDREFYRDWWNAPTLGDYWRLWNMPVHKWLLRTIYFPAIRHGFPKVVAMILVFFISAVFHEVAIGVPLHMVRFWAFAGIMMQIPMVLITDALNKKIKNETLGNLVFWFTFCVVGQPVSLLMYYHDYLVDTRPDLLPPASPLAAAVFPSPPGAPPVLAA